MKSAEILVTGKVQGVWFRDFVQRNAISLKLNGWVKNTSDGNVILEVEGVEEVINNLIEKIKIGSPLSKVKDVEIKWHPFEQKFNSFEIIK